MIHLCQVELGTPLQMTGLGTVVTLATLSCFLNPAAFIKVKLNQPFLFVHKDL